LGVDFRGRRVRERQRETLSHRTDDDDAAGPATVRAKELINSRPARRTEPPSIEVGAASAERRDGLQV
jgi:hypothetical protein